MSTSNYILLFILHFSIYACNSDTPETLTSTSEITMINLTPLSPYQYEFTTQEVEKNAINYFFTERKNWQNKSFRKELEKNIENIQLKVSGNYMLFSVYVYARTKILNKRFKGDSNSLKGVHDDDLISYARWKQGKLDIFYLIDSGNVVFDVLKNTTVSPAWEFD